MSKTWYRLDLVEDTHKRRKVSELTIYVYSENEDNCRDKLQHVGRKSVRLGRKSLDVMEISVLSPKGVMLLEREITESSGMKLSNARRRWYRTSRTYY